MSIMVCIPTSRSIHARTTEAAFAICANHPGGASFRVAQAHPVDRCRNLCVRTFLASPHSHLLFLDDDVVPPVHCLETLLAVEQPVVCGLYPLQLEGEICLSVAAQVGPDTYGFLHDCPEEPFDIDAAGMGCCLVAREVFEQIGEPWFKFEPRPDLGQTGEDIFFFEKCAAAGIRRVAVPQVLCEHHRSLELLGVFKSVRELRRQVRTLRAA